MAEKGREVKTLLAQINDVIRQNAGLTRELNQLTSKEGTFNSGLVKTEQFNQQMAKLNIQAREEALNNEIQIVTP